MNIQKVVLPRLHGVAASQGILTDLRGLSSPVLGGAAGTLKTSQGVMLLHNQRGWRTWDNQPLAEAPFLSLPMHPTHQAEHDQGRLLTGCAVLLAPDVAFVKLAGHSSAGQCELATGLIISGPLIRYGEWEENDDGATVRIQDQAHFVVSYPSGKVHRLLGKAVSGR